MGNDSFADCTVQPSAKGRNTELNISSQVLWESKVKHSILLAAKLTSHGLPVNDYVLVYVH